MNSVNLIGRLTRDPEVRYTSADGMAICKFTIAIDRIRKGDKKETDFPSITVFGKQAENCERFLSKGKMVAVQGRIQTGSYTDKDGKTIYTTGVVADRVEFLSPKEPQHEEFDWGQQNKTDMPKIVEELPEDFQQVFEDIPF